jgi:hypothetical protein
MSKVTLPKIIYSKVDGNWKSLSTIEEADDSEDETMVELIVI